MTNTKLRKAEFQDGHWLQEWLVNPTDCEWAIGHTPFTLEEFQKWLNADDQVCFVLESEGMPVAYGEIWVDGDAKDLELAHIVVSPGERGRGFGKLVTQLLYEEGHQFQFSSVFMRVFPDNSNAIRCYESTGFSQLTELPPNMPTDWVWLTKNYES